ncbi:AAA-domain-containing protein [Sporormia fimetaria CBS 119925]|uniref:AAA-domain-containing protein n=1 Tax=Sporormia fimetaria CBS 119925 TaxID=1340428 RepID=A0A6A6V3M0_9PLEO|nr:AAA-domain-containing protein [Sporormia fimetaria CBS 119925]
MAEAYALRPLERNVPATTLEGVFRVHLAKKELEYLKLHQGDAVRLSTESGPRGVAIAWYDPVAKPANKRFAKVTDLLRDKLRLSLNDKVFIEKAGDKWQPLVSVRIRSESAEVPDGYSSKEDFLFWTRQALALLDVIISDCTFDVQKRGPKGRSTRTRFTVESVEPTPDPHSLLYFDPVTSQLSINGDAPVTAKTVAQDVPQINSDGIGGMSDQIGAINASLMLLTSPQYKIDDQHLLGPTAFLIHGPEGTGKSMLLERLAQSSWQETFRIDAASNPKTPAKYIADTFEKALESQPSLILMDDIDRFLGKAETLVSRLREELNMLEGSKVVVAATARSLYDVDASLRTTSALKHEVELFPPNVHQRENILRQIIGPDRPLESIDVPALAARTHGFVGRDLHKLCGLARNHRVQSVFRSLKAEEMTAFNELLQSQSFVDQGDFDAVIDQVQPTVLKDSILEVPKVRWTDVAGLGHVQELLEAIMIRPFKIPDLDIKFGGPQSRKGVLLYGPPGCAKTLIAQAVATESKQNFLAVKGSELIKMYVGESERAIRDVFRRARAAKPCIIFFDEIDSIGKSREKSQDSGLNVVTTLLNEMDGIEALKEVFIIGATNRPDILDSALIRTGRFDAHIHIGLPNEEARKQIFEINTRNRPLADDVDLGILASRTEDSSGADIKGLCSVAVEMAISDYTQNPESTPEIRMCHFERALEQHVPHTVKEEAERYFNWRPGKSLSASQFVSCTT